jgi:hypothetical protein
LSKKNSAQRAGGGVAIPLTAGLDSRGLLGACLNVLPADRIRCFTLGDEDHTDCVGASNVCQRFGVHWTRIDPSSIKWDVDEVANIVRRVWELSGAFLDAVTAGSFTALARDMRDDSLVLSGYLGDMISGGHILGGDQRSWRRRYFAKRFLNANSTRLGIPSRRQSLIDHFVHFINRAHNCFRSMSGATNYDLLDLGFRQRLWISGLSNGIFRSSVSPYENPRWIGYWLNQDFWDRVNQKKYKSFLASSFPEVFSDMLPSTGNRSLRKKLGSYEILRKIWISPVAKRMRETLRR